MIGLSASTTITDPYRAGLTLGQALAPIKPEVVFLFASIHYDSPEFPEGLHDALAPNVPIVIGNSGDGFYESAGVGDLGAAAMGLNSEGKIRWKLTCVKSIRERTKSKVRQALADICEDGEKPALTFLASEFRNVDASQIEAALSEVDFPVVGGLAGDESRMEKCCLFAGREVMEDAMVMLSAFGKLDFSISIGNTLKPVGHPGLVEDAKGNRLFKINGRSAIDFIEQETGKPIVNFDPWDGTVISVVDSEDTGIKKLRAIIPANPANTGCLELYGGIEAEKKVQVCHAVAQDMISDVNSIAQKVRAGKMEPAAALIVSCTGRKALLGKLVEHEVSDLKSLFPEGLPLAGFPSFGEFAPLKTSQGRTVNLFHNLTYVLLTLGR